MTAYERAKTPTTPGGMFIRNRNNAISVRSRHRKSHNLDQNDNEIEFKYTNRRSRYSSEFDSSANLTSKSEEILSHRRTYSNDWEKRHRKNSYEEDDLDDLIDDYDDFRPVSRKGFERKSEVFSSRSHRNRSRNGPMETLDRRISASTDNLDTLKREKRSKNRRHYEAENAEIRPRSVSNRKVSEEDNDVTFRINGEKMSKNRYFFGGELKSALKNNKKSVGGGPKNVAKNGRKTAVDIFLEDKGPYSRKLYGPPPQQTSSTSAMNESNQEQNHIKNNQRKRARSQEAILQHAAEVSFKSFDSSLGSF